MAAIYKFSGKFKHGNPDCKLYYVTTGKWREDATLEARRQAGIADISNTNLFGSVDFQCFGADEVQRLYRESKNALSREFQFQNRTDIPEIPGITEAYLGYVPVRQFINIIKDEDGKILQSIFYDNVRDWQGDNPVNSEIIATLTSAQTFCPNEQWRHGDYENPTSCRIAIYNREFSNREWLSDQPCDIQCQERTRR